MPKAKGAPRPPRPAAVVHQIITALEKQHPNTFTELTFRNAYELLVATILSAQCTDERVNQVTPALFERYPAPAALSRATPEELEPQIRPTGFFRSKARSLLGMAAALTERHDGAIPARMEDLVDLPGVGRKTANVVLGHALGIPGFPVDRHVLRVTNRLGIARGDDPVVVEQQLCAILPRGAGHVPPTRWSCTADESANRGPCVTAASRRTIVPFTQVSAVSPPRNSVRAAAHVPGHAGD